MFGLNKVGFPPSCLYYDRGEGVSQASNDTRLNLFERMYYNQIMGGLQTKKRIVREFKLANNRCGRCGGEFHYCQLDLHHPGEKNGKLREGKSFSRLTRGELDEELTRVVVLCKNCHAMLHWEAL